jgi:hypothetical protein
MLVSQYRKTSLLSSNTLLLVERLAQRTSRDLSVFVVTAADENKCLVYLVFRIAKT